MGPGAPFALGGRTDAGNFFEVSSASSLFFRGVSEALRPSTFPARFAYPAFFANGTTSTATATPPRTMKRHTVETTFAYVRWERARVPIRPTYARLWPRRERQQAKNESPVSDSNR